MKLGRRRLQHVELRRQLWKRAVMTIGRRTTYRRCRRRRLLQERVHPILLSRIRHFHRVFNWLDIGFGFNCGWPSIVGVESAAKFVLARQ